MMLSTRLALRLLRGGGTAGAIRVGLTVLGVAVGVLAALLAFAVPRSLEAGAARVNDRTPVVAGDESRAAFYFRIVEDDFGDRI